MIPIKVEHYNTNKESGKQLAQSEAITYTQAETIMQIFISRVDIKLTPSDVWVIYCKQVKEALLSSIRARITSLTNKGFLTKTETMRIGFYGKPEHCWIFPAEKPTQLELEL